MSSLLATGSALHTEGPLPGVGLWRVGVFPCDVSMPLHSLLKAEAEILKHMLANCVRHSRRKTYHDPWVYPLKINQHSSAQEQTKILEQRLVVSLGAGNP